MNTALRSLSLFGPTLRSVQHSTVSFQNLSSKWNLARATQITKHVKAFNFQPFVQYSKTKVTAAAAESEEDVGEKDELEEITQEDKMKDRRFLEELEQEKLEDIAERIEIVRLVTQGFYSKKEAIARIDPNDTELINAIETAPVAKARPHALTYATWKRIWTLYRHDPKTWDLDRLSYAFKAPKKMIAGILILRKHLHLRTKMGLHKESLELEPAQDINEATEDEFEKFPMHKQIEYFMDARDVYPDMVPPKRKARAASSAATETYEQDDFDEEEWAKVLAHKLKVRDLRKDIVPTEPPPELAYLKDPILISPPKLSKIQLHRRLKHIKSHRNPFGARKIYIEKSKWKNNSNREILFTEIDGSVRTASWEERRWLLNPTNRLNVFQICEIELFQLAEDEAREKAGLPATVKTTEPKKPHYPVYVTSPRSLVDPDLPLPPLVSRKKKYDF